MRRPETPFGGQDSAGQRGLYLALELSHRQWQLGLSDRRHKMRRVAVEARNLAALQEQIWRAKAHFDLPAEAPVFSCYEAGRDGFWLHRDLVSCGIDNQVLARGFPGLPFMAYRPYRWGPLPERFSHAAGACRIGCSTLTEPARIEGGYRQIRLNALKNRPTDPALRQ